MTQDETIAQVLDPETLKHVPGARITDVKWRHYVDHLGVPSLRVYVILEESITDEELVWPTIEPVERAIRDGLLKARIDLFPYIEYAKQSELDELGVKI